MKAERNLVFYRHKPRQQHQQQTHKQSQGDEKKTSQEKIVEYQLAVK